jgi:hypothetical protein
MPVAALGVISLLRIAANINFSVYIVFTIVTITLGGISVFEYFYRLYNLFRSDSRTRPLNARKSWVGGLPPRIKINRDGC